MSILNIKRLRLTVLFTILTLTIGLVSVNSPLSVKAQDNALSQNGAGVAEQETEQLQSSNQDGQVVSGESSIASGNNILCEAIDNSNSFTGLNDFCEISQPDSPPSQGDSPRIVVRVHATIAGAGSKSLGNYGKLSLDTGQQHYVELLNHSAGDRLSTDYTFRYNIAASGGKLMMDLKPALDSLRLYQFVITKDDFVVTANCSPYSIRSPSTTCVITDPNPQVPANFDITFIYFPNT
jgi:hypothetical protein